jgi:poly-beta-1,6-N-acetyl-D-glucosamine synthase
MVDLLNSISHSWPFLLAVRFLGWFPMLFAFLVINSSRQFLLDRQGIVTQRLEPNAYEVLAAEDRWPVLSVLVSAREEEASLASCLDSVLGLNWPQVEVIAVDDGSSDATPEILERYRTTAGVTVITHPQPQGKAASIDEASRWATGGILLVLDADAVLMPETALLLAAQLEHHPDLGAVTGNPRVISTQRLIEKLQAIEFSATVAAQRRSHSSWGRISTMSGICTMFRQDALAAVGGFDPHQLTEDIEMTWRLQSRGWRVAYEPAAVLGTYMPATLGSWIRQRRRWVGGWSAP